MPAESAPRGRTWCDPADSAMKAAGHWDFVLALPLAHCVPLGLSFPIYFFWEGGLDLVGGPICAWTPQGLWPGYRLTSSIFWVSMHSLLW